MTRSDSDLSFPPSPSLFFGKPLGMAIAGLFFVLLFLFPQGIAAQNNYNLFVKQWNSAIQTRDKKKQARLLKTYSAEAIDHFRVLCDRYNISGANSAAEAMEAMKAVWETVYSTKTLQLIENMRSDLDSDGLRLIRKLDLRRRQAWGLLEVAKKTKKLEDYKKARDEMQAVANGLEELGEKLRAADCVMGYVSVLFETPKKTKADVQAMMEALDRYERLHKEWEWTRGKVYKKNMSWAKAIRAQVKQGQTPGKEAPKKKGQGLKLDPGGKDKKLGKFLKGSKWVKEDLYISTMKKLEEGISFHASGWPLAWRGIFLEGTAPKEMESFKDGPVTLQRLGASKYAAIVDKDNPKSKKVPLKIGAKPKAMYVPYMKGDEETEYAFWFYVGGAQVEVGGVSLNLSPQWGRNKTALIFYRSSSVLSCKIAGQEIKLYDENFNGMVGEDPGSVMYGDFRLGGGLEKVQGHPTIDSMRIGSNKHLLPFSRYVKLGDQWYRLRVLRNNEKLNYRPLDPATVPTGKIVYKWKGPSKAKPKHVIVREMSFFKGAAFDLVAGGKKGVEVPVGDYEIIYGRIYNGKAPRANYSVLLKGKSPNIKVEAGKTVTVQLGAPFRLEFEKKQEGGKIIMDSSTFWVRGNFGVKYTSFMPEVLEPELVSAKDQNGKGVRKLGSWRRLEGNELEGLRKLYSRIPILHLAFVPINKNTKNGITSLIEVPMKKAPFIGLRQSKHKMFGKLLPVWK
jgi:hypothetical protein